MLFRLDGISAPPPSAASRSHDRSRSEVGFAGSNSSFSLYYHVNGCRNCDGVWTCRSHARPPSRPRPWLAPLQASLAVCACYVKTVRVGWE